MASILSEFTFTSRQADAVHVPDEGGVPLTVVTAGAGSGKTRTLVGRYLALVESGLPLRSIVAITFTEKAAREMRTRIREAIEIWLGQRSERGGGGGDDSTERERWEDAFAELDSARIGTIHSLCAGILRAHPAEAGLDPDFGVLDENQAALLKARAIDAALAWAAASAGAVSLFAHLTEHQLRQSLDILVEKRLDTGAAFDALTDAPLARWSEVLEMWLRKRLEDRAWTEPLEHLARLHARQPDDRLEIARREVLACWAEARAGLEARDWDVLVAALLGMRKAISTGGAKGNWATDDLAAARESMKSLRSHFDGVLAPLVKKRPISWAMDERCTDVLPHLRLMFDQALAEYSRLKDERHTLDFDDLEAGALRLLERSDDVRTRWQAEVRAVLVDEFQDTNSRQQQIAYALSGFVKSQIANSESQPGALFVVGDAKQSIYRFRGADVTVFHRVRDDITSAGGQHIPLDLTFRAHAPLVGLVNDLLTPILGKESDPERPYAVPFAPLTAHRKGPGDGVQPPYVEMHLGSGENAAEGNRAAAAALALCLHRLHEEEGVEWGDVALLFRASTGFPVYEDALEQADIPFVTVAGRGFYDRPEVRDLLNALAALTDPTDDLALAGLLRSPAFALSDAALYHLRWGSMEEAVGGEMNGPSPGPCSLWDALHGPLDQLDPSDAGRALRARGIVAQLHALAGRTTVGDLLARFLDGTHYRAALYLAGGHRLCRNVDKLLADAHRSGLVSDREFLEYVQSLRDVAAREGEAPVEAEGAVQLMTVHKAKGLEFRVVVIADAARSVGGRPQPLLVSPELGILPGLKEEDTLPVMYRLASLRAAAEEDAESRRLLYVAATRAKDKLIVSGQITVKKDGTPSLRGWLAWLGEVVGLDQVRIPNPLVAPQPLDLPWAGDPLACAVYPAPSDEDVARPVDHGDFPSPSVSLPPRFPDMVAPLIFAVPAESDAKVQERESEPPPRVWRVVPVAKKPEAPAWVVGKLVHAALRYWRFPDWPDLEELLRAYALEAGLTDPAEIRGTIAEARRLLARFQADSLFATLDRAERHHEVPYAVEIDGTFKSGILDLLARFDEVWRVVEFKTDRLKVEADLQAHILKKGYGDQVREYLTAATVLLGERPRAFFVFLNVGREVVKVPFDT